MSEHITHKKDDFIIWTKQGLMVNAWVDNGGITFPIKLLNDMSLEQAFEFMAEHEYYCSKCAVRFDLEDEIKHQHFAGIYCEECAKEYKEDNKQVCRLCGKPYHSCCC